MTQAAGRALPLVLVADDDPDIRALVAYTLSDENVDVIVARDGAEAIELARERRPDLLVLDVSMPGASGFDVCRAVGATPHGPAVIFVTARGQQDSIVEGLDLGAVGYVLKPFRSAELAARVRAALRTTQAVAALAQEAATDALTGLLTRRRLDERAAEAVEYARRAGEPLTCAMFDIDDFKTLNDTRGHPAGDELLRIVAAAVRSVTRAPDIGGRYGGDEFALLLPTTNMDGATRAADRIRAAVVDTVRELGVIPLDPAPSVSAGIAEWQPDEDAASLIAAADAALLHAKRSGRDRICLLVRGEGAPQFRAAA